MKNMKRGQARDFRIKANLVTEGLLEVSAQGALFPLSTLRIKHCLLATDILNRNQHFVGRGRRAKRR